MFLTVLVSLLHERKLVEPLPLLMSVAFMMMNLQLPLHWKHKVAKNKCSGQMCTVPVAAP